MERSELVERLIALLLGVMPEYQREAAGFTYSGARFERYFHDFGQRFGIRDIYSGGFYPYPDRATFWGWWCRHIWVNRYAPLPSGLYARLLQLLEGREHAGHHQVPVLAHDGREQKRLLRLHQPRTAARARRHREPRRDVRVRRRCGHLNGK